MNELINKLIQGKDDRILARVLSWVENNTEQGKAILQQIPYFHPSWVIGITGPPGAGKSTLTNALIEHLVTQNKRIGVIAVDPTSVFTQGAILGDRIRMSEFFLHPNVFIRSAASRGNLGGLCGSIVEMTDIMRANQRDVIIIETVGVGQSEVEIASVADITLLVLVPEAGDDIQAFKSGIMEIADIFAVNKADRVGANTFVQNLQNMLHFRSHTADIPIVKTIATKKEGIAELWENITQIHAHIQNSETKKKQLLQQKIERLIQKELWLKVQQYDIAQKTDTTHITDMNVYTIVHEILSKIISSNG
jgi:LAO/AO transport system kinase